MGRRGRASPGWTPGPTMCPDGGSDLTQSLPTSCPNLAPEVELGSLPGPGALLSPDSVSIWPHFSLLLMDLTLV